MSEQEMLKMGPFKDGMDHLMAEMALVRHILSKKTEEMTRHFMSEMEAPYRGFGITPTEAAYYLNEADGAPMEEDNGYIREMRSLLTLRVEKSLSQGIHLPLVQLQRIFGLSRFETDVLVTCCLPEIYPGLGRVMGFLQDDAGLFYPSLGLLLELYCVGHDERRSALQAFHPSRPLRTWGIVIPAADESQRPPMRRTYRVDDRIVGYLMGSGQYDGRLEAVIDLTVPAPGDICQVDHSGVAERIAAGVPEGNSCYLVSVTGENRDMVRAFEMAIAAKLRWGVLRVHLGSLTRQQEWNMAIMDALLREALLQPAIVVIEDEESGAEGRLPDPALLLKALAKKGVVVFYEGNRMALSESAFDEAINYVKLTFDAPPAAERLASWKEALGKNSLEWPEEVIEQLVVRYPISKSRIEELLERLALHLNGNKDTAADEKGSVAVFQQIANNYTAQPLDELAQHINPAFSWDDMVLHKTIREHLMAFRNTIAHQFRVYETWGFGDKMPRGRGIVALFSGPSGTGKTMAAEVIAGDLGINLYRVDMAGLVSKYIGETEKNIKRIFDASKTNVLLFFDEADALFGRRTEMRDSHDRYANLEVNYLLQRLEDHDGPVILATNMRKNMDEAFLRRIHFIIEFSQPSEPFRRLLFQKYLPVHMPRADDLDISLLAKHFEMSGGDIKNAAVQAAFIAAGDGGQVTMEHLLTSIRREYMKLGKIFPNAQLNHVRGVAYESPDMRRRKKGRGVSWS